jgi:hypothetical protein
MTNRVLNKWLGIRHGQPIEVREVRIDNVIVAMTQISARQTPPEYPTTVDVLLDGIPRRELRRRAHPTRVPLLVNQEKLH